MDMVVLKFQTLHHFFFVLRRLLMDGDSHAGSIPEPDHLNMRKFSSEGGFLKQPVFDSSPVNVNGHPSNADSNLLERFYYLLSETAWPSICRCLLEGKAFIDNIACQMTCIRILEILPSVFERISSPCYKQSGFSGIRENTYDFSWLHDYMDWGKSSLKTVVVYWQRAISSLLNLLKGLCNSSVATTISTIENLISCDCVSMDELMEQVSHLSVSLSKEVSSSLEKTNLRLFPEGLSFEKKYLSANVQPLCTNDPDIQILHSPGVGNRKHGDDMIVLSDDETESISPSEVIFSETKGHMVSEKSVSLTADKSSSSTEHVKKKVSGSDTSKDSLKAFPKRDATDGSGLPSQKQDLDRSRGKIPPISSLKSKYVDNSMKELIPGFNIIDSEKFSDKRNLNDSSEGAVSSKKLNPACNNVVMKAGNNVLKEIACDSKNDSLQSALGSVAKTSISAPKRQIIQLKSPFQNRPGHWHRPEPQVKRFKSPSLDKWFRPILEIDYFALVGVASASENDNRQVVTLKEVPVQFHSPEQYVEIFSPLVLEEFKAQLYSSFVEMSSWKEIYFGTLSVLSVERVDDFHLVRFAHDVSDPTASSNLSENDLVLLTKEPPQNSSHDVHILGKVERRDRDNQRRLNILIIRFYLVNGTSRLHQARRNLLERSKWHASRVLNITPQLREFQALSSIKDIPLLPVILRPMDDSYDCKYSKEVDLNKLSQPLQRILKSSFNDSQLQAISTATGTPRQKKYSELSLIQGPPGTGKTKTIVAIVSALLASPLQKTDPGRKVLDGSLKQVSAPKINQAAAIARAWQDAALARQLNEDVQKNTEAIESFSRGRVLICAQSNAAVDELVSRISSQGLYGSDGKVYKPYLVRVGNAKTVHPNSLPFFMDTLVDQRLGDERMKLIEAKNDLSADSSSALRSNLEKLVDRIRFYEAKRANLTDRNPDLKKSSEDEGDDGKEMSDVEISFKLRKLYEQKSQIYKDLSTVQQREKKANEEIKGLKYKLRRSILREAEIVVSTLSGCGGDLYGVCSESMSSHKFGSPSEHTLFDAVVIDEAAQALEPATLIPLQLLKSSGTKCIMVGDPKQLPATVLSNVASKFLYKCSMFERLQRAGHPVIMLTKQYRMHPEICQFPSLHFYEKKLLNGDDMSSKSAPFHETEGLGPYIFYDVVDGRELRGKNSSALSLYNEHEANAAVELLKVFRQRYPSEFLGGRIGIITPYKCQLSLLRSRFSSTFGSSTIEGIELNTIDGFQGREVDILILSTVRATEPSSAPRTNSRSIGFVADVRRMNVALTRAKISLWILGNAKTLQTNESWGALIKDAQKRNLVRTAKVPYKDMVKTAFEKSSGDHSLDSQHVQKIKDASHYARKTDRSAKEELERKTERIDHVAQSKGRLRGGETVSGTKEASLRNKAELSVKDGLSTVVLPDDHNKISKDPSSAMSGENVTDGKSKHKDRRDKKINLENNPTGKRNFSKRDADSEQRTDDCRPMKSQESKRAKRSSEGDRSQTNQVSALSTQSTDSTDGGRASDQVGTTQDFIARRKKQREAVDAILHSALIPSKNSKKSETSVRAVAGKRPPSSSTGSSGIKPSKSRKD